MSKVEAHFVNGKISTCWCQLSLDWHFIQHNSSKSSQWDDFCSAYTGTAMLLWLVVLPQDCTILWKLLMPMAMTTRQYRKFETGICQSSLNSLPCLLRQARNIDTDIPSPTYAIVVPASIGTVWRKAVESMSTHLGHVLSLKSSV
jgi:hypothetical protein